MIDDDGLESIVIAALERLPEPFRDRLGSVAIVIEDEPTPAQLESVGARGLFGLYQGVPRTAYGADQAAVPSKITLFREYFDPTVFAYAFGLDEGGSFYEKK